MKTQAEVDDALDVVLGPVATSSPPAPSVEGVSALPSWRRLALLVSGVALVLPAVLVTATSWGSTQHVSLVVRWVSVAILFCLAGAAGWVAVKPRAQGAGLVVLAAVAVAVASLANASGIGPDRPLFSGAMCAVLEFLYAGPAVALSVWALSRFSAMPLRAVAAAVASGAGAVVVLMLHCPDGGSAHQGLFHLTPWGLMGVIGLLARQLRPATFAP